MSSLSQIASKLMSSRKGGASRRPTGTSRTTGTSGTTGNSTDAAIGKGVRTALSKLRR